MSRLNFRTVTQGSAQFIRKSDGSSWSDDSIYQSKRHAETSVHVVRTRHNRGFLWAPPIHSLDITAGFPWVSPPDRDDGPHAHSQAPSNQFCRRQDTVMAVVRQYARKARKPFHFQTMGLLGIYRLTNRYPEASSRSSTAAAAWYARFAGVGFVQHV